MDSPLEIPNEIPIIVLSQAVLFPNSLLPLHIFEDRYRAMLRSALDSGRIFGVAQELEWGDPALPVPDLAPVMGIGVIRACVERTVGTLDLILQGLARVEIVGETLSEPFRTVQIRAVSTEVSDTTQTQILADQLRQQSRALRQRGYQMPQKMDQYLASVEDPEVIGDLMAAAFIQDPEIRQEVLETSDLESRLEIILMALKTLSAT